MRVFNSFQIVAAFVAWPYLIQWLSSAEFCGSSAAFYSAAVLYVAAFIAMTGSVYESIGKGRDSCSSPVT
jgi:glucan phosphoethanolaminetransferase (alkaline phosphatase superfamily)